jgi:hypothetical protein
VTTQPGCGRDNPRVNQTPLPALKGDLRSQVRALGLLLLLVSPFVWNARALFARWRAFLTEDQAPIWMQVRDPGSTLTIAGVALLELAGQPATDE